MIGVKRKNIAEADTLSVKKIMVQPTINPNVYREIVTGMLISVYRTTTKFGLCHALNGDIYYKVPKSLVFIKIYDMYNFGEYSSSLEVADLIEIEKYIMQHTSYITQFRQELNDIFQKAESYYESASLKSNISKKAEIKIL